jgi:nitroreductase
MSKALVDTILARRSIRAYTDAPVSPDAVRTLLEAAMAAPSASNNQPWHFVVVTERRTLDALADAHPYGKMLTRAPLCIAVCGDTSRAARFWVQDCSAATENLLLASTALGLGAVWLGVYPLDERVGFVRRLLALPRTVTPLNLLALGHPAETKPPRTQYDATRVHRQTW